MSRDFDVPSEVARSLHLSPTIVAAASATGAMVGDVPNKPKTPIRGIRVPDELWRDAQAVARARNEDVSAEVRAGLERYVKRNRDLLRGGS